MALIRYPQIVIIDGQPITTGLPYIPPIAELMPSTRRWRKVKPCGTGAAWRRHQRRKEPQDERCRAWHAADMRKRRAA